jgi:Tfp pilus assembly protein PilZ
MVQEQERRSSAQRVPFVRRCTLQFDETRTVSAFLVNINVLGAYVEHDEIPRLGEPITCRFQVPGQEGEITVEGVVAWTNPQQQHPVHSLPPGFGFSFHKLSKESRERIEGLIADYLARQG